MKAQLFIAECLRRQEVKGYNIEALKSIDTSAEFASRVIHQLRNLQTDGPVEDIWKQGSSALVIVATEVLCHGRREPKK